MLDVFVIGRHSDILPFKATGAKLIEVTDENQAGSEVIKLIQSSGNVMLMMSEDLADKCKAAIAEFRENTKNIFLSIPSLAITPGARMEEVRSLVARSLGVDLLGQKKI